MSTPATNRADTQRRNRAFEQTHRELIEAAAKLLSERGPDAVSIAALARAVGLNRTTVYYHFDSREALLAAVKDWSGEQLAQGMNLAIPQVDRIGQISRFVLDNPELIKLWIDGLVVPGDIRTSYPSWNDLVAGIQESFARNGSEVDAEVYCTMLLTAAIIGPHVFRNAVAPDQAADVVAERFMAEQLRMLERDKLG